LTAAVGVGNVEERVLYYKTGAFGDSGTTVGYTNAGLATDATYVEMLTAFNNLLKTEGAPITIYATRTEVSGRTGLLDDYPGAAAAYSLRLLDSTYTGSAIRVRRASDNAEQDIGFDGNGDLDTTALATFCSGTDGFVKIWYCQSGNGNDAEQTTTGSQPKIYDSSTGVITQNGKPAASWDGSNDYLQTTYDNANNYTAFYVQTPVSGVAGQVIGRGDLGSRHVFGWNESNKAFIYRGGSVAIEASGDASQYIGYLLSQPSSSDCRVGYNGTTGTTSSLIGAELLYDMVIGAERSGAVLYGNSHIQEIIFYPSDQSSNRTGIETNINNYYSIY
jgi:hypothetical protein